MVSLGNDVLVRVNPTERMASPTSETIDPKVKIFVAGFANCNSRVRSNMCHGQNMADFP